MFSRNPKLQLTDCLEFDCHMCGCAFKVEFDPKVAHESDVAPRGNVWLCDKCYLRVPSFVRKATDDVWPCRIGLRNGQMIEFHTCSIDGEFLHVEIDDDYGPNQQSFVTKMGLDAARGVDIRIDEIVWATEASS